MSMSSRSSNSAAYRYGFNGKESDDEIKGEGAQYDYGLRIYDPRLGKFLSVDPLTNSYPMLTPYQFASNTPIWAMDVDGAEAWVYTETDGVGHAFIVVPSADDVDDLVVYSYGRYNGSTTPSLGGMGPVGDGVLIRLEGESAKEFIKKRLSIKENGILSTNVFELPKADAAQIRDYFDEKFESGKNLPEGSKAKEKYGDQGRIIDQYTLFRLGRKASNCVTKTCEGIIEGESLIEFTTSGDGGAYIDLRNQIDPKILGGLLFMMDKQDASENSENRNIIDVTDKKREENNIDNNGGG